MMVVFEFWHFEKTQIGTPIFASHVPMRRVRILAHAVHPPVRMTNRNNGQYIIFMNVRGMRGGMERLVMRRCVFAPWHLPTHTVLFARRLFAVQGDTLGDLTIVLEQRGNEIGTGRKHASGAQHAPFGGYTRSIFRTRGLKRRLW